MNRTLGGVPRRRVAGALAKVVLLGVALVALGASPASAHAEVVSSSPGNGETVATAPDELVIGFSESVEVSATHVSLLDEQGTPVDVGQVTKIGGDPTDTEEPVSLAVSLPPLPDGSYRVQWSTLSSDDLHITEGSFVFGVGGVVVTPDAVSAGSAPPEPAETALRWIAVFALAVLIGGSLVDDRMTGARAADWQVVRPRVRRWVVGGAALATLVLFLRGAKSLLAGADQSDGGMFSGVLLDRWLELLVTVGVMLAVCGAAWYRQQQGTHDLSRRAAASGYLATFLAMLLVARHGHAAADGAAAVVMSSVHLASTAAWLGVVVVCTMVVVSIRGTGLSSAVLRAATPVAIGSAVAAVVTGLLLTGVLVPSIRALTDTAYGQAILLKTAFISVAAVLGLLTFWLVRGNGGPRRFVVVAELGALGAVALLGGLMASSSPPSQPVWWPSPADTPTIGTMSMDARDLLVTVTVAPNRPGDNFVTVATYQTRTPTPGVVEGVTVSVNGSAPIDAVAQRDDAWVAPSDRALRSGPVALLVTIDRAGMPPTVLPVTWRVAPAAGTELGGAPLSPLLWSALALLALAGCVVAYVLLRTRRRAVRSAAGEVPETLEPQVLTTSAAP